MIKKKILTFVILSSLLKLTYAQNTVINKNEEIEITTTSSDNEVSSNFNLAYAVKNISTATILNQSYNVIICNNGPYTVTLPQAKYNQGKSYYIKNVDKDNGNIIIDGFNDETIDGSSTYTLENYNQSIRIICDGIKWYVIEEVSKPLRLSKHPCGDTIFYGNNQYLIVASSNPAEYCNCDGTVFKWNDVTSITGKIWMDRNLGAKQVATTYNDVDSYGDYFQWGRSNDGHQCRRTSTSVLSSSWVPHDHVILTNAFPYDWLNQQNDELWQGINGINNPCPSGYRVPTYAEFLAEKNAINAAGIIEGPNDTFLNASVLKLPSNGRGRNFSVTIYAIGTEANYWTSTTSGTTAYSWSWQESWRDIYHYTVRGRGAAVRCIKD